MSDLTDRLDAIQTRMDAATEGPWRWDDEFGARGDTGLALTNEAGAEIVGAYNHHCCSFRDDPTVEDNDAEFIAAAPTDVAFLLDLARKQQAALDAVRELHVMEYIEDGEHSRNRCAECLYEAEGREECPTIGAIEVTFERLEAKP